MLHIRQLIYLVLTNVLSTSFLMFHITFDEFSTTLTILVKVDVLDRHESMICSYFGIAFLLFFMKIENTVYISFQNSTLLFINGFFLTSRTFKISGLMLAPLRSVNDWRFPWLCNVFLKSFQDWLSSVEKCQGNVTKTAGQKMFISWQTYEGLKISGN